MYNIRELLLFFCLTQNIANIFYPNSKQWRMSRNTRPRYNYVANRRAQNQSRASILLQIRSYTILNCNDLLIIYVANHVKCVSQSNDVDRIQQQCIIIPNRTIFVRFGGISGEFGRAMVCIFARRMRAKIPMARPNDPEMSPKCTKMVRLGIYRTQISLNFSYPTRFSSRIKIYHSFLIAEWICFYNSDRF